MHPLHDPGDLVRVPVETDRLCDGHGLVQVTHGVYLPYTLLDRDVELVVDLQCQLLLLDHELAEFVWTTPTACLSWWHTA